MVAVIGAECLKNMKLFNEQLFSASYHFVPIKSDFSPDHSVLEHLNLCSSFNLRNQVSHPYKTTGVNIRVWTADGIADNSELHGRKH
jgi:hypothetical protein